MSSGYESAVADQLVSYLGTLIATPTEYPPGNTSRLAAYLQKELSGLGYSTEIHARTPGIDNVVARMGQGRPSLVFNTHIDTVAAGDASLWSHPPLQATVEDGHVFGLGAANCKGSGAVQLWLAREIARRGGPASGEVVFTFVADEESLGRDGMLFLRECALVEPDMLLLGAPTNNTLITTERGVLWLELTTLGRAAHAGQPDSGDNAILRMARVLGHLDREMVYRLSERSDGDMRSTINVGLVSGGSNANVVPGACVALIDRRLLPSESVEQAFAEITSIVRSVQEPTGSVSVRHLRGTGGFVGRTDGPLVSKLRSAIQDVTGSPATFTSAIGVSDGRYFAEDGIEIVNFGPGEGCQGHASNESVAIVSLTQSALILRRMVEDLLGLAA